MWMGQFGQTLTLNKHSNLSRIKRVGITILWSLTCRGLTPVEFVQFFLARIRSVHFFSFSRVDLGRNFSFTRKTWRSVEKRFSANIRGERLWIRSVVRPTLFIKSSHLGLRDGKANDAVKNIKKKLFKILESQYARIQYTDVLSNIQYTIFRTLNDIHFCCCTDGGWFNYYSHCRYWYRSCRCCWCDCIMYYCVCRSGTKTTTTLLGPRRVVFAFCNTGAAVGNHCRRWCVELSLSVFCAASGVSLLGCCFAIRRMLFLFAPSHTLELIESKLCHHLVFNYKRYCA